MQTGSASRGRLISKSLIASLVLLLAASILFAPRSEANFPNRSQAQETVSDKPRRPEFVPGEALVRFKHGRAFEGPARVAVPDTDVSSPAQQKTGARGGAISNEEIPINLNRFAGSDLVDGLRIARMAPADTLKAISAFKARDDVLYAEPNYFVHPDATPNDPRFLTNELYGLTKIGAPQAWDITTGSSSIVVGVIDEGIDISHSDLQANIWTNPAPGAIAGFAAQGVQLSSANYNVSEGAGSATITVTRDPGDLHGFDFVRNSGIIPAEGHATHVAGTIGAVGNNGVGVVGVNWQVGLISLRFIDQATNNGSDADAIRAYNYARQMHELWITSGGAQGANIRVLNNSYGGASFSQATFDAISALNQSNILFVAAAGNDHRSTDVAPNYPSNYSLPNVISVAATDSADGLAGFSNFGAQTVLMGAPGVGILSTIPNNQYGILSGTSMATPHVSGAAALLLAQNPNLTVNKLRALLEFNGDIIPALAGKSVTGRRLNVSNSLQALASNDTTPPGTVSAFQITSQTGRTINLSWISSGDDLAVGQASLYDISFTDSSTNAVIPLTTIVPTATGSPQNVSVNIPYRHPAGTIKLREFDKVGNEGTPATVNVNVDPLVADPYIPSTVSPAALSTGGSSLAFNCDDCFRTTSLPFAFPFFGTNFGSIKISSNGNIYFEPPTAPTRANGDANDVPSSVGGMSPFRMIAGMWDDLDLRTSRRADADVYVVQPDASRIIFRWQGVQFGDGTSGGPINFEIELNSNGIIKTRYGSGNTNLFPVVGISGGEPDVYSISTLTSELSPLSLTNAQSAVFTPRSIGPVPPPEPASSPAGIPAPQPTSVASPTTATPLTPQEGNVTVALATSDTAGAQDCSVMNGKASSRCDYLITFATISFAAGETSKTISIPIVDDSYQEANETFTVSLSNASGAPLGTQSIATVTIIDNDGSGRPNPLDTTGFFVRQHYLDFLNREPDALGLNFWTNNINNCSPQPACIDPQRVNTSTAFFLSIEFQETGYLVERIYKAAYADGLGSSTFGVSGIPHTLPVPIVRLNEFLPDTQEIGQGVIVGQGNWQQQLESNKVAFIAEFAQRSRFTTAFPSNTSPAAFVDKLFANAGVTPLAAERGAAIAEFAGAADISNTAARAKALRDVAENQTLSNQEFNRAFVLMQFFGYLRRNPNDPQDPDYTGYDFWLTKLNSFTVPGDAPLVRARKADMVKAFLVSTEYRQRFGP